MTRRPSSQGGARVAARLQITAQTVRAWLKAGRLAGVNTATPPPAPRPWAASRAAAETACYGAG